MWAGDKISRQFTSYLFVGGGAALVEWGTFALLYLGLALHYIGATVIAFILATLVNFVLGKKITFRKTQCKMPAHQELMAVFLISAVGLVWNMFFMFTLVTLLGWPGMMSKVMATGLVLVWNFLMRKLFLYKI